MKIVDLDCGNILLGDGRPSVLFDGVGPLSPERAGGLKLGFGNALHELLGALNHLKGFRLDSLDCRFVNWG